MDSTASVLFSHFTSAALVVYLIQVLKTAPWFPWLHDASAIWLKRAISVSGAFLAHIGISYAWHTGTVAGTHVLILTIPAWQDLVIGGWRLVGQFVTQEGWYQIMYNRIVQATPAAPKETK